MTEIDRLALARRVYVEHARASKGNIQEEWVGDVMAGEAKLSEEYGEGTFSGIAAISAFLAKRGDA